MNPFIIHNILLWLLVLVFRRMLAHVTRQAELYFFNKFTIHNILLWLLVLVFNRMLAHAT